MMPIGRGGERSNLYHKHECVIQTIKNKVINKQSLHNPSALVQLGEKIMTRRKVLKVRAQSCADAAGISRFTLRRIEKGESSVNMGAYI